MEKLKLLTAMSVYVCSLSPFKRENVYIAIKAFLTRGVGDFSTSRMSFPMLPLS